MPGWNRKGLGEEEDWEGAAIPWHLVSARLSTWRWSLLLDNLRRKPSVSPKELRAWAARCGKEDQNPGLWDSRILSSFWRLWAPGCCGLLMFPRLDARWLRTSWYLLYFQCAPDLPGWCPPRWHSISKTHLPEYIKGKVMSFWGGLTIYHIKANLL